MAPAQKVGVGAPDKAALSSLQIRVAVLCALIQMLDGYDLSAIGLAAPALIKAWGCRRRPPPRRSRSRASGSWSAPCSAARSPTGPAASPYSWPRSRCSASSRCCRPMHRRWRCWRCCVSSPASASAAPCRRRWPSRRTTRPRAGARPSSCSCSPAIPSAPLSPPRSRRGFCRAGAGRASSMSAASCRWRCCRRCCSCCRSRRSSSGAPGRLRPERARSSACSRAGWRRAP
jgi:hypothetical protein